MTQCGGTSSERLADCALAVSVHTRLARAKSCARVRSSCVTCMPQQPTGHTTRRVPLTAHLSCSFFFNSSILFPQLVAAETAECYERALELRADYGTPPHPWDPPNHVLYTNLGIAYAALDRCALTALVCLCRSFGVSETMSDGVGVGCQF